jgi:hypothetical protein
MDGFSAVASASFSDLSGDAASNGGTGAMLEACGAALQAFSQHIERWSSVKTAITDLLGELHTCWLAELHHAM